MADQKSLRPCEKFQREGQEWDRLVVLRKDTTGQETVIGRSPARW